MNVTIKVFLFLYKHDLQTGRGGPMNIRVIQEEETGQQHKKKPKEQEEENFLMFKALDCSFLFFIFSSLC